MSTSCKLFFLLIFFLHIQNCEAQDSLRSSNIQSYPDHFFLWPVIKQRSVSFEVRPKSENNPSLLYKPNTSVQMGLGLYLFEIGFELAFSVPLSERSKEIYGKSDARDLQANLLGKGWGIDLFHQNYHGFYRTDSQQPVPKDSPLPQRKDIEVRNLGINGIYVLNKKRFSLRSAYNFSERQLRSSGSWIATGTVNTFHLNSDSSVLTGRFEQLTSQRSAFSDLRYTTLSVAPGYAHTFIYRHLFFNLSFSVGPAHHWINYQSNDGKIHDDIAVNTFVDVRLALGYNSNRWFGGISFVNQSRNIRFEEIQFTNSNDTFRMVIGLRFHESGILKKRAKDFLPPGFKL